MNVSINTTVQLKVTGFKPFNKTENKPAGIKLQSRNIREEGGISQFEIKVFELSESVAKALKGKSIQLDNCKNFRPEGDYAPSYWSTLAKPVELKHNVEKVTVNTIVEGKVEAVEAFSGEKMSGYTLFFIVQDEDSETIYNVKMVNMDETTAKSFLHKDVRIEQCKPLGRTSFISEEKVQPIGAKRD